MGIILIIVICLLTILIFCSIFLDKILEHSAINRLRKLLLYKDLKKSVSIDKYYRDLSIIVNRILVSDGFCNIRVKESKYGKGWFVRCNRYKHIFRFGNYRTTNEIVYFPSSGVTHYCGDKYFPRNYLPNKEEAIKLQRKILDSQLEYILSMRIDIFSED